MRKHISVNELRVGMKIVNPRLDWTKYPYLYAKDTLITSEKQIEEIKNGGYQEVVIDLAHSNDSLFTGDMPSFDGPKGVPAPQVSLEEELPRAILAHTESVKYARALMEDARAGKVDLQTAMPHVEALLNSLERNSDALVCLCRLSQPDEYTYTHSVNVSILASCFARFLGKDRNALSAICLGGFYHDIGKALTPAQLLNAPRRLTDEEFAVMKQHVIKGFERLQQAPGVSEDVLLAAMEHHEKFDGSGYPKGLVGEQISLIGRIFGIVDTYDALTSKRVYKDGMFPHKALSIIYQMRGKDFQASLVDEFVHMVGIYPVGSIVALEDGSKAVVSRSNESQPLQPVVIVAVEPDGKPTHKVYDLAEAGSLAIERGIPVDGSGIEPLQVLGITAN